jgi:hypothetical protein
VPEVILQKGELFERKVFHLHFRFVEPRVKETDKTFAVPRVGFNLPVKVLQSHEIALGDPRSWKKGEMLKIITMWC